MREITTKKSESVERFIELVRKGIECWVEAGQLVAKAMESNPDFVDEVCDSDPDMSPEFVLRFRQIGLRKVHPRLLLTDGPGARRLIRMDYKTQSKYISEPLDVVTESGEILKIDVRNLTSQQAQQVFTNDHIRSPGEQRAWVESFKTRNAVPERKSDVPYRVTGKSLVVMEPCTLTRKDMARLLAEMEL